MRRACRAIIPFAASIAALTGCTSEQTASVPHLEVRLYFPSEAAAVIAPEIARFNSLAIKSSSGPAITVVPFQSDGITAASRLPTSPSDRRPALWLASSSLALDALNGATDQGVDCVSLATSDLGIAIRERDLFAINQHDGVTLLSEFVRGPQDQDKARRIIAAAGDPISSSSGLAVAAMEFALALGVRTDVLTVSMLASAPESLRASQQRLSRHFSNDHEMLRWLAERSSGQPAAALSSRQQVLALNASNASQGLVSNTPQKLAFVRVTAPHLALDYPICRIDHAALQPDAQDAQRLVHKHFSSKKMSAALRGLGFTSSEDILDEETRFHPGSGNEILRLWPIVSKPSAAAIVVDTSSGSPEEFRRAIARELGAFARPSSTRGDSLCLISTSTRAELLSPLSSNPAQLQEALEALPASGAAVPLDGLSMAFSTLEAARPSQFRRAVLLLASQDDAGSSVSLAQLQQSAEQSLVRNGGALYILALRAAPIDGQPASAPPTLLHLASELDARYLEVDMANLSQALRGVLDEIE